MGIAFVACLAVPSVGQASNVYLCVSTTVGSTVTSGGTTAGNCGTSKEVQLPEGKAEQETLISILPSIKYEAKGVDSKPTIKFHGINLQIVNDEGKTTTVNGEGNLVVGYDEIAERDKQTGSHDLIVGNEQTYTSYAGIVAGRNNTISAPGATVTGGYGNTASSYFASVTGGSGNTADGQETWVGGGSKNLAEGSWSTVSGGLLNTASGETSTAGGGYDSNASGEQSTVSGAAKGAASGAYSTVSGGDGGTASGTSSTVSGGWGNNASKSHSTVSGGDDNTANGIEAWVGGGYKNIAEGTLSAIFGGQELKATKEYEAIP